MEPETSTYESPYESSRFSKQVEGENVMHRKLKRINLYMW